MREGLRAGQDDDRRRGVELARECTPDVVLLDLDMPSMSGLEALPLMREASPTSKIVVLSSFRREDYEGQVRAGGATGFLEKGITARRLVDELLAVTGLLELVEGIVAEVKAGLGADTTSASHARRFVDRLLSQWHCEDLLDDVQLLVSELVTKTTSQVAACTSSRRWRARGASSPWSTASPCGSRSLALTAPRPSRSRSLVDRLVAEGAIS